MNLIVILSDLGVLVAVYSVSDGVIGTWLANAHLHILSRSRRRDAAEVLAPDATYGFAAHGCTHSTAFRLEVQHGCTWSLPGLRLLPNARTGFAPRSPACRGVHL